MTKFCRITVVSLVLFASVLLITPAWAAMGRIDGFALTEAADKDLVGAGRSIGKDDKPDAEFTIRVSGAGAISGFSIKNLSTGQVWNTSDSPNILLVVDSDGAVINSPSSLPTVAFLLATSFRLYVNDRAAITEAGGTYELTVRFIDNSTATTRTTIKAVAPSPSPTPTPAPSDRDRGRDRDRGPGTHTNTNTNTNTSPTAGNAKIITSSFLGRGNYDLTNETKKLGSNINPDYRIDVSLAGSDTLTGVRIRATGGNLPDKLWDTVPTTNNPLLAVTDQGRGTPLNSSDGSISIPIRDLRDLSLWFDGNDEVRRQDFRLTFLSTGGRIDEVDIKQAPAAPQAPATPQTPATPQAPAAPSARREIQMSATPAQTKLDVVGKNREKMVSGLQDYSLMIEVRGEGTIKAISVVNQAGHGRWDTVPGSSAWLTIVRKGGSQVNNPKDFSVSIPVRGTNSLELLMEDDGTLSRSMGRLLVSVTWDDGEVVEEHFTW